MAPPAYLFLVRHGSRLDAADKQWHLSSPTPYDPPLTYSGWQQAKSVGARIASIVRERVAEDELAASRSTDATARRKRKRYQFVVHSSPFLRCIQTSIAVIAGLAQDSTPIGPTRPPAVPPTPSSSAAFAPHNLTVVTDVGNTNAPSPSSPSPQIRRSVLRLDAFLGEWLSPGYFELITPPPSSVMMLASAKAELLRREDYTHHPNFASHTHSNSQGHLWSPTPRASAGSLISDGESNSLGSMASLTNTLPRSPSVSSQSSQSSSNQRLQPQATGYVSPVPNYAINSNNTIPPGFVSHARDACVDIDYQWDSTRGPLDWGDGGTFPEEWATMHKRFRAGVQRLIDWYYTSENPTKMVTRDIRKAPVDSAPDDADDVETEAVVIVVSHGAGCNALIGAVTHRPVLVDVGMTSLTMAVRKPNTAVPASGKWRDPLSPEEFRTTPPIHELYDLKLLVDTDHLRSPVASPNSSRSPSISSVVNGVRGRHLSFSTGVNDFSWNDNSGSRNSSANAALSSLRKSSNNIPSIPRLSFVANTGGITVGSGVTSFAATRPSILGRTSNNGLWSPPLLQDDEDDEDDMVLNFSYPMPAASATSSSVTRDVSAAGAQPSAPNSTGEGSSQGGSNSNTERSPQPEPGQPGAGPGGLWGAPRPPDEADRMRDLGSSRRRWTVPESNHEDPSF